MLTRPALEIIFSKFITDQEVDDFIEIKSGHINETYKVTTKVSSFVLQSVNAAIFKDIGAIENNIKLQNKALQIADYQLIVPIFYKSIHGNIHEKIDEKTWRVMSFIPDSKVLTTLSPEAVLEAASSYSAYLSAINTANIDNYKCTIEDFKNPIYRWNLFYSAIQTASQTKRDFAASLIEFIFEHDDIIDKYEEIELSLVRRVAHNDAKLTNILFDSECKKATAVIDLDTLQKGSLLDDFGDMVRSMSSYLDENSIDFENIRVDESLLKAVIEGFLKHLKRVLTKLEKENLFLMASLTIYIQGIRFLTDFLEGNTYYQTQYEVQNYDRAKNQFTLLCSFLTKEKFFNKALKQALKQALK